MCNTGIFLQKQEEEKAGTESPNPGTEVNATPDSDIVEERRRVTDDDDTTSAKPAENAGDKRAAGDDVAVPKKKPLMSFVKASDS